MKKELNEKEKEFDRLYRRNLMQEKDESGRFLYSEGLVDRILSNLIDKLRALAKQKPDPINSKERRMNLLSVSYTLQKSCNELSGGINTLGDLINYLYET